MSILSEFRLDDMLLRYLTDEVGHVGMQLIPVSKAGDVLEKRWSLEPLVQCHVRGDQLPNGYGNGHTMATTPATDCMKLVKQEQASNIPSSPPLPMAQAAPYTTA